MDENPYQSPSGLERPTFLRQKLLLWGTVPTLFHVVVWYKIFCSLVAMATARQTVVGRLLEWETSMENVLYVLSLPLLFVIPHAPNLSLDALVITNSVLWGFGLAWLLTKAIARFHA